LSTFVSLAHRLLIRHRLGPFFLAIILVVVGFTIGITSHQVVYQRANHVIMNHYVSSSSDNKIYISLKDGSLYILTPSDFTPKPNSNSLFSRTATLIYDPQETSDVKISATNSTAQLSGTGATVVQLITYGADGSSKTFTSEEYATYPHGFYRNNWGIGVGFMLAGIALGIFLFFFARYRKPFSVALQVDLATPPYNHP
jgi:hypothetical protein